MLAFGGVHRTNPSVDGSEIPNNHLGWCKNLVNNGINYLPQLVQDFFHQQLDHKTMKDEGFKNETKIWAINPKSEGCGFPWKYSNRTHVYITHDCIILQILT